MGLQTFDIRKAHLLIWANGLAAWHLPRSVVTKLSELPPPYAIHSTTTGRGVSPLIQIIE
jgi:hypothetical protein